MRTLKIARIMAEKSQWELSRLTGLPNYRISLLENGRVKPKKEELARLAEALHTTVAALETK